jgi:hypothetical protein
MFRERIHNYFQIDLEHGLMLDDWILGQAQNDAAGDY